MSQKIEQIPFKASANLQRLIGRELIPNEEMAIVELVKNSYDSGAKVVTITIQSETDRDPGIIELRDNGSGMKIEELRNNFLFAGYSSRPEQVKSGSRVPTGEKGIGRFAADRLGSRLVVRTKTRGEADGLLLDIDWNAFADKRKLFNDVTALCQRTTIPGLRLQDSGTTLEITSLRTKWTSERLAQLRTFLCELFDPFSHPSNFQVNLQTPGSPKVSGPVISDAPADPDLKVSFRVAAGGKVERTIEDADEERVEVIDVPSGVGRLEGLHGQFLYYKRRPNRRDTHGIPPGVRVYRDGFRIEPFGSPTADWLGISEKRAKRAGHAHIVPGRLFGFIEIHRQHHSQLSDTTSRQALLDPQAALELVTLLKGQLSFLEDTIKTTISEPRWRESRMKQAAEFEQARLQTLGVMSFGLAHELRQPLQAIKSEAHNIRKRLSQLSIDDEDISAAQEAIDRGVDRINRNIDFVASISKGSLGDVAAFDLAAALKADLEIFRTRCESRGISIDFFVPESETAHLSRSAVSMIVFNLIRNSIDAVEELKGKKKGRIRVSLSNKGSPHVIEVSDNGGGIPEEIQRKIFKKFSSKKTGGMGVGLYYCKMIAEACGGDISYETSPMYGTKFKLLLPDAGG